MLKEGKVERRYPDQVTVDGRTYRLKVYGRAVRPLTDREYAELRADIQAKGRIEVEILVDRHGNVVDGKHRLMIAAELGLTGLPIKVLDTDDPERLEDMAEGVNVFRRHLTKQQISALKQGRQERVRAMRAERKSLREIAEVEGVAETTIRRDLNGAAEATPGKVQGMDGALRPARKTTQEETAARRRRVAQLLGSGLVDDATVSDVAAELDVTPRTIWRDVKALGMQRSDPTPAEVTRSAGADYGIVVHEVCYGESCLGIDREAAPLGACLEAAIGGLEQLRARVKEPELVELVESVHKVVESVLWRILEGATT